MISSQLSPVQQLFAVPTAYHGSEANKNNTTNKGPIFPGQQTFGNFLGQGCPDEAEQKKVMRKSPRGEQEAKIAKTEKIQRLRKRWKPDRESPKGAIQAEQNLASAGAKIDRSIVNLSQFDPARDSWGIWRLRIWSRESWSVMLRQSPGKSKSRVGQSAVL